MQINQINATSGIDKIQDHPYCLKIEEIEKYLKTNITSGLDSDEVAQRQKIFGPNKLEKQKSRSRLSILLDQLLDPMIYILLGASILAIIFQEWMEASAILIVILITSTIGYLMEVQAIKSIEALRKMSRTRAKVLRDQKLTSIPSEELVPGDIMYLQEGDVVSADGRIFQNKNLGIKEDALTGESGQVDKTEKTLEEGAPLTDQKNMVFSGTIVSRGSGKVLITATGVNTVIGQIDKMSQHAISTQTPLDKKLMRLNHRLINICLSLVVLVLLAGIWRGKDLWLMIETSIALAVAAIPEGLPIVATVALARGMLKLAKKNVIIKKMESVQTLGEVGLILTDKTGTLTENKMDIHDIHLKDLDIQHWTKEDYKKILEHPDFSRFIQTIILCNNVTPDQEQGDPLEMALYNFARKLNINFADLKQQFRRTDELPFDSNTRIMLTVDQDSISFFIAAKGAAEEIISICQFPPDSYTAIYWQEVADRMAENGLRTLALASKRLEKSPIDLKQTSDLEFIGIVGFLDSPRPDVNAVIKTYQQAGIKVIMVTGDHPNTAKKIAEEIGLFNHITDPSQATIKGRDIPDLNSIKNQAKLLNAVVFARVLPIQKLSLVEFFQKHNFIVGMTGDGVNDAPALKKADVGIAMGVRGTEAAKEVADIILEDDQFTSIHDAIYQGRTIFENIRKFVVYLMSSNFAEIAVVAFASLSNLPQPLLPLQILFLNLVTDVFPALAISTNEVDEKIMTKPPRPANEPIMTKYHWSATFIYGFSIALWVSAMNIYATLFLELEPPTINNLSFYTLVLSQLLNLFNLPAAGVSPLLNEVTKNHWVWIAILLSLLTVFIAQVIPISANALTLVPLSISQYLLVILFSFGSLIFSQMLKNIAKI